LPFLIIIAILSLISVSIALSGTSWHIKLAIILIIFSIATLTAYRIIYRVSQSFIKITEYIRQVASHNWDAKPDETLKGELRGIVQTGFW
jgi:uncharacterized membrane protein